MPRAAAQTGVSLDGLEWRQLGPFRGGRVEAVAGDPRERNTFYFGSCGGGVVHQGGHQRGRTWKCPRPPTEPASQPPASSRNSACGSRSAPNELR